MAATKYMFATFDASTRITTYGGAATPVGTVTVNPGAATEIVIALFTVNGDPTVGPAVIDGLTFPSGQPSYIDATSPGPSLGLGESSPTWLLTDNFLGSEQLGSTPISLSILYNSQSHPNDPTIVNTDPGNVVETTAARPPAGVARVAIAAVAA